MDDDVFSEELTFFNTKLDAAGPSKKASRKRKGDSNEPDNISKTQTYPGMPQAKKMAAAIGENISGHTFLVHRVTERWWIQTSSSIRTKFASISSQ